MLTEMALDFLEAQRVSSQAGSDSSSDDEPRVCKTNWTVLRFGVWDAGFEGLKRFGLGAS